MEKVSYAVKIDLGLRKKIKGVCAEHGIKQGYFVEKALSEQLLKEEFTEDLLDFKNLRSQEINAVGFEDYIKNRN